MRLDRENRLEVARESARRRALEDRVARRHSEVERDYRNRCREAKIRERVADWEKRETERIAAKIEEARKAKAIKLERLEFAKQARREALRRDADLKKEALERAREVQKVREVHLKEIEEKRKAKALEGVAEIKRSPTTATHLMLQRFAARQLDCKLDEVILQCLPGAGGLACLPHETTVGEEWRSAVWQPDPVREYMPESEKQQLRPG
jgi:hypothetical protein